MGKHLSEMSLEELWRLFPIVLTAPCACWSGWYEEEASALKKCLPLKSTRRISHIGSTAIHGIWAKPIIDILIEMSDAYDLRLGKDILAKEYEALKLRLWKQYKYNRDAYTESKTSFVEEQTRLAKLAYKNRYEVAAGESQ